MILDPSISTSTQDPTEPIQTPDPSSYSTLQELSDDISPKDPGDPNENHKLQKITDNQACLSAPKQAPYEYSSVQRGKCNPLLIVPAAVQKGRPPSSVKKHASQKEGLDGLPKIKTTKTLVWAPTDHRRLRMCTYWATGPLEHTRR